MEFLGFSFSNSYAAGTLGRKVASIPDMPMGSISTLKQALETGDTCGIQILTDSTGNDTTDWPYILGQQIAASYPGFTVDHICGRTPLRPMLPRPGSNLAWQGNGIWTAPREPMLPTSTRLHLSVPPQLHLQLMSGQRYRYLTGFQARGSMLLS